MTLEGTNLSLAIKNANKGLGEFDVGQNQVKTAVVRPNDREGKLLKASGRGPCHAFSAYAEEENGTRHLVVGHVGPFAGTVLGVVEDLQDKLPQGEFVKKGAVMVIDKYTQTDDATRHILEITLANWLGKTPEVKQTTCVGQTTPNLIVRVEPKTSKNESFWTIPGVGGKTLDF